MFRLGLFALVIIVGVGVFAVMRRPPTTAHASEPKVEVINTVLVDSQPDTLRVQGQVIEWLGIKTALAQTAPPPAPLKLEGSLFLDPNRLTHVHTRFAGEVVEIGKVSGFPDDPEDRAMPVERPVRFGDRVTQSQLLCVLWSKDLGEKKSELVDSLSRLFLDQETQRRLEELWKNGAVPERSLREAERNVESDMIAVSRAERTLRSWRLTTTDIEAIRAEAVRIHHNKGQWDDDVRNQWARVEVRAAIDGVVVEKNVTVGDVVDTALDLFKIADLSRLDVLAHAYEEDLPLLEDLPPHERHWHIHLKSDPEGKPLSGSFNQIGNIIDPNQHTALVMGWVNNLNGRLRVGQFVTAEIDLPSNSNEVAIPVGALIDEDALTYVFVQPDPHERVFTRRRVLMVRGRDNLAYIQGRLSDEQRRAGYRALQVGERVVISGGLELGSELGKLQAQTAADKLPATPVAGQPMAAGHSPLRAE
ncbi:MAG TPA: efflux RND transporter periplasmic adaptor subunit [Pirellulales bacterium]|jgi:cobalt-zinc-cadmium efflux system membrane fusion protein|nr:efflux RND transporter periplasmic adaptor subunit [Pirellulales bacterium]